MTFRYRVTPRVFFISLLAVFFALSVHVPGPEAKDSAGLHYVKRVIDGDTIILDNGDHVRYIGINSPEVGEPFYDEAKKRNSSLVEGKRVRLIVCPQEPRDKYGRLLAFIYLDDMLVNKVLLAEGLARLFIIPPCGTEKELEFGKAEKAAKARGAGIWGGQGKIEAKALPIKPGEAIRNLDRYVKVKARVAGVRKTRDAVFIDLGRSGEDPLSIVIFRKTMKEIEASGGDLMGLKGKTVTVYGVVKLYKGRPEIVVNSPSRLKTD